MHLAALIVLTTTLVLRTGEKIVVQGPVTDQNGTVVFRSSGALYSIAASEIDVDATNAANAPADDAAAKLPRKLKVTAEERERLLRDLEQNHAGGKPAADLSWTRPTLEAPSAETAANQDEWRWRREARAYEESLRQAEEDLSMLRDRADELRDQIRGFLSLGYKPSSFSYQTTQLALVEDQIPAAELAVRRAQRAYDQFRDDARKQGVMPGWLR